MCVYLHFCQYTHSFYNIKTKHGPHKNANIKAGVGLARFKSVSQCDVLACVCLGDEMSDDSI